MLKKSYVFLLLTSILLGVLILSPSNYLKTNANRTNDEIYYLNSYEELGSTQIHNSDDPYNYYARITKTSNDEYNITFYYPYITYQLNNIDIENDLPPELDQSKYYEIDYFEAFTLDSGAKRVILHIYQDDDYYVWDLITKSHYHIPEIILTDFNQLPYFDNGEVFLNKRANNKYDIIFHYYESRYIAKEVGLPETFDTNKDYYKTWSRNLKDGLKISFESVNDENDIIWDPSTGDYLTFDIVEITGKKVEHIKSINPSLYNEYKVHFNTDIPIDDILKVDISFDTYKKILFFPKYDKQSHTKTIEQKTYLELTDPNNKRSKFSKWLNKLVGNDELKTIQPSTNKNYDWEFYFNIEPDRFAEQVLILKLYYITDGNYYEAPTIDVPTDPDRTPGDGWGFDGNIGNSDNPWGNITLDNLKNIGIIVLAILGLALLGPVIQFLTLIVRLIINIIKMALSALKWIILLPINIIQLFTGSSKSKNYNYKI